MKTVLAVSLLLLLGVLAEECPDVRPENYFETSSGSAVYQKSGLPAGYVQKASGMTTCELYKLQQYCVDLINEYRQNKYKFSDGRMSDHNPSTLTNLQLLDSPFLKCHNEKALSDLRTDVTKGGCGHYTAGANCGFGGTAGTENSCCRRGCDTFENCKKTFAGCMQQMWDEGQLVLNGQRGWSMTTGHYYNMISNTKFLTCGFGFDAKNQVYMTQNFWGGFSGCKYNCANESSTCGKCYKGPSTVLPVVEYVGCFLDNPKALAMNAAQVNIGTVNRPRVCAKQCGDRGFQYAAMRGTTCYCGNEGFDKYGASNETLCSTPCPGSTTVLCGATAASSSSMSALSVYKVAGPPVDVNDVGAEPLAYNSASNSDGGGPSGGAVAAAVICTLLGVALIAGGVWYYRKRVADI
eukprot:Colp12_sorted_trinity150504_noHs@1016